MLGVAGICLAWQWFGWHAGVVVGLLYVDLILGLDCDPWPRPKKAK